LDDQEDSRERQIRAVRPSPSAGRFCAWTTTLAANGPISLFNRVRDAIGDSRVGFVVTLARHPGSASTRHLPRGVWDCADSRERHARKRGMPSSPARLDGASLASPRAAAVWGGTLIDDWPLDITILGRVARGWVIRTGVSGRPLLALTKASTEVDGPRDVDRANPPFGMYSQLLLRSCDRLSGLGPMEKAARCSCINAVPVDEPHRLNRRFWKPSPSALWHFQRISDLFGESKARASSTSSGLDAP
jgi:hypothetical protein